MSKPLARWPILECSALTVAAAIVRCMDLGASPLWLDEAYSVLVARESLSGIVDSLSRDGHPPLFFILLHFWTALFGVSEAAVRALPVLFGIASVAAVYWAGRTFFPAARLVAPVAGAITAIGPLHVYYSRQCRMYSLTPLIGVLALLALQFGLDSVRRGPWAAHAVLLALGLYCHNYFLFLRPLGPTAALLAPGRVLGRRAALVRAMAASAAAAIAYLPWIPTLVGQSRSGVGAWIPALWAASPPSTALLRSFEVMGIAGPFPGYLRLIGALQAAIQAPAVWVAARIVGTALGLALVVGGLAVALRRSGDERDAGTRAGLFLGLPLVVPWTASFFITPIYLVGRYEMVSFAGYAILAARGFAALVPRSKSRPERARLGPLIPLSTGAGVAVLWLAGAAFSLVALYRASTLPRLLEEKQVAEWLLDNTGERDLVILPGFTRAPAEYYLRRWGSLAERVSFPPEVEGHLGWFDYERALRDSERTQREAADLAMRGRRALEGGGHVVLVLSPFTPLPINQWLGEELQRQLGEPQMVQPARAPSHALAVFGGPPVRER